MKSICIYFFFYILFISIVTAQAPSIQWQKTFGGSEYDRAFSICNTKDHGFAVVGGAESLDGNVSNHNNGFPGWNNFDIWLLKLDSTGSMKWNNCYGGDGGEEAYSLSPTLDGGFIISGVTTSFNGDVVGLHGVRQDFWVVKTDSIGNLIWQKCLGGAETELSTKIIQTSDSGYFVVGETESRDQDVTGNHGPGYDIWAVKLNSSGVKQWAKCYGGSYWDDYSTCVQTKDSGFLIAGHASSDDGQVSGQHNSLTADVWVVKIDLTGEILWQKCYGGYGDEAPAEIIPSTDGGFYIAGGTDSNDGDINDYIGSSDFWLFKIDNVGNLQWSKCYGGMHLDVLTSACKTSDGGIAMAGFTNVDGGMVSGTHGDKDIWVVKTDSVGNLMWAKALGGTGEENAASIIESPDRGLVVAGYTLSTDGDITSNRGKADYWIVKLAPLGLSIPEIENSLMELKIFQNNNQLSVRFLSKKNEKGKLSIYDLTGRKVVDKNISIHEGINNQQIICDQLSSTLLFLKIYSENGAVSKRVFIE